ncbi:MAG: SpoIIE family protein phosphatase [Akkermansiaceae bacterium]|nr:SpoIIE family protein phosphatase [Armatimonadota bacterium]
MTRPRLRTQEVVTYAQNIVDTIRDPLLILNSDLRVLSANRAFYQVFRTTAEGTENQPFTVLGGGQWNIPELVTLLKNTITKHGTFDDYEVEGDFSGIGQRVMLLNARELRRPGNGTKLLVLSFEDVTTRKSAEADLSQEQNQDKKIARALLRPMLFQPKEDAFSGLMVQTAYAMASDEALVGGDFWDTFAYDHGHVALVLGDVMGHGLTSAIFTTELKHTMRAYIREHEQPDAILYHMNQFLYQSSRLFSEGINTEGSDAPVCIALAVIERETGAGTLAIAGMEPPIIVRANGDTDQPVAAGMPLGVVAQEEYKQVGFQLEAGDTLILSTDGITEARQGRNFLDTEGLIRLAVEGNRGDLEEMANTIMQGARDFAGGKLRDDASIVLARRTANSPRIEKKQLDP